MNYKMKQESRQVTENRLEHAAKTHMQENAGQILL